MGRFKAPNQLKQYFSKSKPNHNIYWFHASSLGEFFQVKTLIEGLKEEQQDITCIVSFSSPSGFDNAQSLKGGIEAWRNEIDSSIPAY